MTERRTWGCIDIILNAQKWSDSVMNDDEFRRSVPLTGETISICCSSFPLSIN